MRRSPRERRLAADYNAMVELRSQSSILEFETRGNPIAHYYIKFQGIGLESPSKGRVELRDRHEIIVELGAAYPRMIPNLQWKTPIFHPNISANGVVCLGGYGTHWVPSLTLDELCNMLWDMIRYKNFDTESPYNRDAAYWAKQQTQFSFPLDRRQLRDRVSGQQNLGGHGGNQNRQVPSRQSAPPVVVDVGSIDVSVGAGISEVDDVVEIIDATVDEPDQKAVEGNPPRRNDDQDIVFID